MKQGGICPFGPVHCHFTGSVCCEVPTILPPNGSCDHRIQLSHDNFCSLPPPTPTKLPPISTASLTDDQKFHIRLIASQLATLAKQTKSYISTVNNKPSPTSPTPSVPSTPPPIPKPSIELVAPPPQLVAIRAPDPKPPVTKPPLSLLLSPPLLATHTIAISSPNTTSSTNPTTQPKRADATQKGCLFNGFLSLAQMKINNDTSIDCETGRRDSRVASTVEFS
ncbi:hypothetical protein L1987_14983 [Smallanthus sonchifolius]|uniref:Uncharacterized protein n=1 Tax=Smallanthus sonchifolius TaxID=185202 RepID=A0ACB9J6C1_9ASTR|nr:hypothetical protein L1987_14983 [Smallanthus sonchifolius]